MHRLKELFQSIKDDGEENKTNLLARKTIIEKMVRKAGNDSELNKLEIRKLTVFIVSLRSIEI